MTPRRLAAAALVLLAAGAFAAIAALTSDPAPSSAPAAEPAPSRPAAPAAPAAASAGAVGPASAASAARAPAGAASSSKPVVRELKPSSGPAAGGGQVVIHGSNLGGVAQVMFGTTPARVAAREEGELTVDVPSGAPGAATIVLTNGDGSYAVAPSAYTYR